VISEYKFIKIKGHHYISEDGKDIKLPSPEPYPMDAAGMPTNIKRIYDYPNNIKGKLRKALDKFFNKNQDWFFEFERTSNYIRGLRYTRPPRRPQGAMRKIEVETEINLEEKCLKEGLLAPSPIAKIKYPFKFNLDKTWCKRLVNKFNADILKAQISKTCLKEIGMT